MRTLLTHWMDIKAMPIAHNDTENTQTHWEWTVEPECDCTIGRTIRIGTATAEWMCVQCDCVCVCVYNALRECVVNGAYETQRCMRPAKATAPTNLFDKLFYVLNTVVSRCSKTLDRFTSNVRYFTLLAVYTRYEYFQWIYNVCACDVFFLVVRLHFIIESIAFFRKNSTNGFLSSVYINVLGLVLKGFSRKHNFNVTWEINTKTTYSEPQRYCALLIYWCFEAVPCDQSKEIKPVYVAH